MKITQIRFSHAIDKDRKDTNLAVFSVELDHQLIIHDIRLITKGSKCHVQLPEKEMHKGRSDLKKAPRVWFNDVTLFNNLVEISTEMYDQLVKEYEGYYNMKVNGKHRDFSIEELQKSFITR